MTERLDLHSLLARLERSYLRLGVREAGVLLAVSGGADSTALLVATQRLETKLALRLEVACLDHGLRPESNQELEQVRHLADGLELPFHARRLNLAGGSALEARARLARYQALEELRRERKLEFVATAHTASDQAETLLLRLSRGSSLRGAAGILPSRGEIIRPLLDWSRADVELFLEQLGQGFAQDPMNADLRFSRARVRHQVLPALESALGPGVAPRLARFSLWAGEDEQLLSRLADEAFDRLVRGENGLDSKGLRALELPLQRRALVKLIQNAGAPIDADTLGRALLAVERAGTATLGKGWVLRCQSGTVRCCPSRTVAPKAAEGLLSPDQPFVDGASGLTFRASTTNEQAGGLALWLPEGSLPLRVRHRRPGDRVGSKKLQDLFVDRKVLQEDRDRVPLVCDASGKILWVVGFWRQGIQAASSLQVSARPTNGTRAHEWLLRYRVTAPEEDSRAPK